MDEVCTDTSQCSAGSDRVASGRREWFVCVRVRCVQIAVGLSEGRAGVITEVQEMLK